MFGNWCQVFGDSTLIIAATILMFRWWERVVNCHILNTVKENEQNEQIWDTKVSVNLTMWPYDYGMGHQLSTLHHYWSLIPPFVAHVCRCPIGSVLLKAGFRYFCPVDLFDLFCFSPLSPISDYVSLSSVDISQLGLITVTKTWWIKKNSLDLQRIQVNNSFEEKATPQRPWMRNSICSRNRYVVMVIQHSGQNNMTNNFVRLRTS